MQSLVTTIPFLLYHITDRHDVVVQARVTDQQLLNSFFLDNFYSTFLQIGGDFLRSFM